MCGIAGYIDFTSSLSNLRENLKLATTSLGQRGPDCQATYYNKSVGLGHTRLSIIDTSTMANQPMSDRTGRYTLVFNGEIYDFKRLAQELEVSFHSSSDTEVLLYLLIKDGPSCLPRLNGFFAFAFYDAEEEYLLIARDRMGIKPLHYYAGDDFLAFGSEMKALMKFPIERKIDHRSLYWYLQLTYLPRDLSMVSGVKKLLPGHFMEIKNGSIHIEPYYQLNPVEPFTGKYEQAKSQTIQLLESSVKRRMVADVPLGAFLSGGTDSSAVVSMASKFDPSLHTFSIGYRDHPFFDETNYAEIVARKFKTNHTTFSLTNDDLLACVTPVMDYIDEPFADSSAIPTYLLSQKVSKHIKAALSGDGADELFGGYYKHLAFMKSEQQTVFNQLIQLLQPILSTFPQSRSSSFGNTMRRISKFAELAKLSPQEKYWRLASFYPNPNDLLKQEVAGNQLGFNSPEITDLNQFLDQDLQIVLPGDMLTKVDLMSMANGLEVRVPFLDKELVAFARSLPSDYKVKGNYRKRVLQDAFEHLLPKELHHRPKKGFEVPMLHWLRNELFEEVNHVVFNRVFLEEQGLFKTKRILELKQQLFSKNPGDVHVIIWSLYVFQKWFKKYLLP